MSDATAPTTVPEILETSVNQYALNPLFGSKVAGSYRWITYRDFADQVDRARAAMAAKGFKHGDRVGIISGNRVEWAVIAYAAYQLGGVVVPMYEFQAPEDWQFIVQDSEPTIIAVSKPNVYRRFRPLTERMPSVGRIVLFEGAEGDCESFEDWMQGDQPPAPRVTLRPSDLADLIYTSGTTGRPKGVMLSHANITTNINSVTKLFPFGPGDVSLSFLPWAHAFGQVAELHALIAVGAAMGIAERPETILANLTEVRPTVLVSVPRIFNRIYEALTRKMQEEGAIKRRLFYAGLANTARLRQKQAKGADSRVDHAINGVYDRLVFSKVRARFGGRLKYAMSGGAALAPEAAHFIDRLNIMVYEGYGLTETSPIIACNYPGNRKIGSVGKPLAGVTVRIEPAEHIAHSGEGEIVNFGPNNMLGYYKMPEETAATIRADGGLRTGDLGYLDEDGFLFVTGRLKELYKLENGKYVAPAPLEEDLQLSPYMLQVMLYGENLPHNVAVVVPEVEGVRPFCEARGLACDSLTEMADSPEVHALIEEEVARISRNWRSYERPRRVVLVDEEWSTDNDLLTPTLKLKRRNVVNRYRHLLTPNKPWPREKPAPGSSPPPP